MSDRDVARAIVDLLPEDRPFAPATRSGRDALVDALAALPLERMDLSLAPDDRRRAEEIFVAEITAAGPIQTQDDVLDVLSRVGLAIATDARLSPAARNVLIRDCLYCGYPRAGGGTPAGAPGGGAATG